MMMVRTKKGISEKHLKILAYLKKRQEEQGYPPSIREICDATAGRIVASAPAPVPGSDFSYYDTEASVEIARSLLPVKDTSELYALEVQGDSMIDAMINDGDIVVMKKANEAKNGEMVAVWLNDKEETTLKYFYTEGKKVRLQPANPTMKPIIVDDPKTIEVQGKVVMVIRKVGSLAA